MNNILLVHDAKVYNKSALKRDFVQQEEFSMVGDTAYGISRCCYDDASLSPEMTQ